MFLAHLLYRTAQLWPEHPAVACDGRTFTWIQTFERVRRLAAF
jgi:acyl-CoA synthetase (AMP-forming)/AMP-acid ligase II